MFNSAVLSKKNDRLPAVDRSPLCEPRVNYLISTENSVCLVIIYLAHYRVGNIKFFIRHAADRCPRTRFSVMCINCYRCPADVRGITELV